jgi:hypothetical protein
MGIIAAPASNRGSSTTTDQRAAKSERELKSSEAAISLAPPSGGDGIKEPT